MLCLLSFGLVPAVQATAVGVISMIKRDPASARRAGTTRGLLVASQLALSLVLLVGAGLMARAFISLHDVPLGFGPHGLVTMKIDLPPMRFTTTEQREAFYDAARASIQRIPGVDELGIGRPTPLSGRPLTQRVSLGPGEPERVVSAFVVFSNYAETLRVPLQSGRLIADSDRHRLDAALMVDDRMAAEIWPGDSPIGKRLLLSPSSKTPIWGEVVGVVGHVQVDDLEHSTSPQLWVPFRAMQYDMDIAVRTRRDGREIGVLAKEAIERLNGGRPVFDVRTLDDYVSEASADTRFALFVLGAFALLAVTLAAIGVYGVVAYSTARRTREIALRLALGADAWRIISLVAREGFMWSFAGLAAGAIGARLLTRYVQSLLFHVTPNDALTFGVVGAVLAIVALVATVLPATRAMRVDPMLALRGD
jgi:putative ABC transport system permease protein